MYKEKDSDAEKFWRYVLLHQEGLEQELDQYGRELYFGSDVGVKDFTDAQMFFSASIDYAKKHDELTCRILEMFQESRGYRDCLNSMPDGYHFVVDTRITHCMKGQYPSIPGWHCDEVPRNVNDDFGQPDFLSLDDNVLHWLFLLSTDDNHCNTEFLDGSIVGFPHMYGPNELVYSQLDRRVNAGLEYGALSAEKVPSRCFFRFDQEVIHRATPATSDGWRLFLRVSCVKNRPIKNVIRRQVQVYLADPSQGW